MRMQGHWVLNAKVYLVRLRLDSEEKFYNSDDTKKPTFLWGQAPLLWSFVLWTSHSTSDIGATVSRVV